MKVVLDTNVLVSGIFYGGIPAEILDAWVEGRFVAYATPLILGEYLRAIEDLSSKDLILGAYWNEFLPKLCRVIPDREVHPPFSRDPTDDKFLSCSASVRADYLVTGDKDLKVLEQEFPFKIISPREFLKAL